MSGRGFEVWTCDGCQITREGGWDELRAHVATHNRWIWRTAAALDWAGRKLHGAARWLREATP